MDMRLTITDEEKEIRQTYFEKLFVKHDQMARAEYLDWLRKRMGIKQKGAANDETME